MARRNFKRLIDEEPYHDTETMYIGVTKDAETAATIAANDVTLMRIHQDKWPKEIRPLKKQIRFVIKEAGERNFLVVISA
ncbi:MAG: hypothetical protein WCD86_25740 [Ktedonobacteraceae bacterium]